MRSSYFHFSACTESILESPLFIRTTTTTTERTVVDVVRRDEHDLAQTVPVDPETVALIAALELEDDDDDGSSVAPSYVSSDPELPACLIGKANAVDKVPEQDLEKELARARRHEVIEREFNKVKAVPAVDSASAASQSAPRSGPSANLQHGSKSRPTKINVVVGDDDSD